MLAWGETASLAPRDTAGRKTEPEPPRGAWAVREKWRERERQERKTERERQERKTEREQETCDFQNEKCGGLYRFGQMCAHRV